MTKKKSKTSARQTAWLVFIWAIIALIWVLASFKAAAITFLVLVIVINFIKFLTGKEHLVK